jgi:hypothetical protein
VLAIGLLMLAIGLFLAGILYALNSNWFGALTYVLAGLIAVTFSQVTEKI